MSESKKYKYVPVNDLTFGQFIDAIDVGEAFYHDHGQQIQIEPNIALYDLRRAFSLYQPHRRVEIHWTDLVSAENPQLCAVWDFHSDHGWSLLEVIAINPDNGEFITDNGRFTHAIPVEVEMSIKEVSSLVYKFKTGDDHD